MNNISVTTGDDPVARYKPSRAEEIYSLFEYIRQINDPFDDFPDEGRHIAKVRDEVVLRLINRERVDHD